MLKMMMMSIMTYKFKITSMSMFTLTSITIMSNYKMMFNNSIMLMDMLSLNMILLTTMSMLMVLLVSKNKMIMNLSFYIMYILLLTFISNSMLMFYITFELVLIPTMIMITLMGKQPERLQASIYLLMYTIMASLPLLIMIISMNNISSFTLSFLFMKTQKMLLPLTLAFMVKMPMYFTHLWLPKAHVEAPLEGSMMLATILLKMGGYGLIRFMPMCLKSMNKMNYWIISISMIGASATSLNCIRQKDLKSLIAYSSVAHMSFVLSSIMTMNYMGMTGAIMMMIAHGMTASAMFLLTNDMYVKYHTRNILMFKGMSNLFPNIYFWWFIFMAMNMSAPPSINTMSEILLMSSMITWNNSSMIMITLMSLLTSSFSMSMFINISQNKMEMMPSIQTQQKTFLTLCMHITPLLLILTKIEMIMY